MTKREEIIKELGEFTSSDKYSPEVITDIGYHTHDFFYGAMHILNKYKVDKLIEVVENIEGFCEAVRHTINGREHTGYIDEFEEEAQQLLKEIEG